MRRDDGVIRVLSRVCRHRWMPVVADGRGHRRFFQCPHHLWTYALDGRLVGAPDMDRTPGFDRAQCRLPSLRVETWMGWVLAETIHREDMVVLEDERIEAREHPWRARAARGSRRALAARETDRAAARLSRAIVGSAAVSASDAIGSIGVALLLLAFFLNAFGWLDRGARSYQLLNLVGAAIAGYASWRIGFLPFVVLEGTWALVALVALLRGRASRQTRASNQRR